jgi:uncharacterized protein YyaL (SSP411 family)
LNKLAGERSSYLLSHAHNPVEWFPWGDEALQKARRENKLLIVSIGYAACHWCHVMEKESFSKPEVAEVMNRFFVSIKVDREERPDIDSLYMDAALLLSGSGGWPLNALALPDGRPVFAGTYYPKEAWLSLLGYFIQNKTENPKLLEQQAEAVARNIRQSQAVRPGAASNPFSLNKMRRIFNNWINEIDFQKGGHKGAPKFPMPAGYEFMLNYYHLTRDKRALEAVIVALDNIARGGIFDQAGGGFARYTTDASWRIPHFEKMLYDNAQLVSLYSQTYQLTRRAIYRDVVYRTLSFIQRELTSPECGFYSSLDADSEGLEGKYYVWTSDDFNNAAGKEAALLGKYYNITTEGNWKNGENILYRTQSDEEFAFIHKIPIKSLRKIVSEGNAALFRERNRRVRPALDDKILAAWNGLMLKAWADAYRVFGENHFLETARRSAGFIREYLIVDGTRVLRRAAGTGSKIDGFLDDYAMLIKGFITLYQAEFDEKNLETARRLTETVMAHFKDPASGLFFFTDDSVPAFISRKIEIMDNVLPSANSVMADNLHLLGLYFQRQDWVTHARGMLKTVGASLVKGRVYYANWSRVLGQFAGKFSEVAIVGKDWHGKRRELDKHYLPNILLMGGPEGGKLPNLLHKTGNGGTRYFICRNNTCLPPVYRPDAALKLIMEGGKS